MIEQRLANLETKISELLDKIKSYNGQNLEELLSELSYSDLSFEVSVKVNSIKDLEDLVLNIESGVEGGLRTIEWVIKDFEDKMK